MARKKKLVMPSRRPKSTLKPKLFTLKPETIERLQANIATGSTSAFVDDAINAAIDLIEAPKPFKFKPRTEDTPTSEGE